MSKISKRKIDHINIILEDEESNRDKRYFDSVKLNYRCLPEINFEEIDTKVNFLDKNLSFPLLISSMTGGDGELIKNINKNLAIAAEKTKVAMAVGSQRIMFKSEKAKESFDLRKYAPSTVLIGNVGAVQLNYGFTTENFSQAIEILDADGLYLHLNPLQEVLQPEGDTNFKGLLEKISHLGKNLPKPLLIKEVGAGISKKDAKNLLKIGMKYIDVAGTGGTSWSYIEGKRNHKDTEYLGELFADFGIPTPICIKEVYKISKDVNIIASGGIRNGIDMVKSMILGARMCGMAGIFLKAAMESSEAVEREIRKLEREFKITMFLLGIKNVKDLVGNSKLLSKSSNLLY